VLFIPFGRRGFLSFFAVYRLELSTGSLPSAFVHGGVLSLEELELRAHSIVLAYGSH
jgi:hypothetical protein